MRGQLGYKSVEVITVMYHMYYNGNVAKKEARYDRVEVSSNKGE
jgi:hypothetical protein